MRSLMNNSPLTLASNQRPAPMSMGEGAENRFAWLVMSLLFAAAVMNYMDRTVLSIIMPQIRRDLSLSNEQYGFAVNSFLLLYMVTYPLGGYVADRLGCRRTFVLNVCAWSVASMLQALSKGFLSLCAFRGLLGATEGGFPSTAIRGLAEWFPSANRAKAVGIMLCGISLGSVVAPPLVAGVTLVYGWRAAFLVTGALGFLLVPPWLILHRRISSVFGSKDPAPARRNESASFSGSEETTTIWEVLRRRKFLFILVARSMTDAIWFFYLFWAAGYFQEARGFGLANVGRFLWIPFLSADLGALAGSWISSGLIRRGLGVDRSRKSVMVVSALLGFCGAGVVYVSNHYVALALLSVTLLGLLSWAANVQTAITEISPPQHVAVLYGITGSAGTLLSAISQPLIGRVVDGTGYVPVFVAAGAGLIVALGIALSAGKIERIGHANMGFEREALSQS